jgi:SnoaL-like protein
MTNVNETVVRYIAAWNERDPKRRRELVAAEDGSYIDAHRHGKGHGAIDAMLATTQAQFPGYRLNLISGIEAHNNFVRFSWAAGGTNDAPLYLGGTDFATLAPDGRINVVAGFIDAAPAPMK